MSMMVSFVLSFFPRDVLDEILKLIESVSEDFPSYSCVEKEYSEFLFLTKNNSFLQNRHFPVAMVTEWDKGELSNGFLWFNLS